MQIWVNMGLQAVQVLFVLGVSPLVLGILNRWKEFVQGKKGPSIFQMYRDLRKLFNSTFAGQK